MQVEYDLEKNDSNFAKHGLWLADFAGFDAEPVVNEDARFDYGEVRFVARGRIGGVPHAIVYTRRGDVMRLIGSDTRTKRKCVVMSKLPPPPDNFDDIPEWTEEDAACARPASEVHGPDFAALLVRPRGRPVLAEADRKQKVNLRLSPDVANALRETGPGWQGRADEALRKAFVKR